MRPKEELPMDLLAFQDEMEKISVQRSLTKDFLGGVDPTGTRTFGYGMHDAGQDKRRRAAIGAIGGLVGGATVVPAVISGIIGGAQGLGKGGVRGMLTGAAKGSYRPFAQLYRASKGAKTLGKLDSGAKVTKEELRSLTNLVGEQSPALAKQVKALAGDEAALRSVAQHAQKRLLEAEKLLNPEITKFVDNSIAETVRAAGEGAKSKVRMRGLRSIVDKIVGKVTGKTIDMAQKAEIGRKATERAGRQVQERIGRMAETAEGRETLRRGAFDLARKEGLFAAGQKAMRGKAIEAGAALSLSSLIGGGSAYLQYSKGTRVGESLPRKLRGVE